MIITIIIIIIIKYLWGKANKLDRPVSARSGKRTTHCIDHPSNRHKKYMKTTLNKKNTHENHHHQHHERQHHHPGQGDRRDR